MAERFDLAIIGSGNAGYIPAIRASQLGMTVAIIEKESVLGGTCLNIGCIPTKALLQTASMLNDRRRGEEFGLLNGGPNGSPNGGAGFDYARAAGRKDRVVARLEKGVRYLMRKNKVQVFTGVGSFVEPKKIRVQKEDGEAQELEADNVLIATGSAVRTLPDLEIDHEKVISSDDAVKAVDYPKSVVILGSGAVGVEFASMYNDFGSEVTIVEVLNRILPGEDPEISAELEKRFEERGMRVMTSTIADPRSIEKTEEGITIRVAAASEEEREDGEAEEKEEEGGYGGGADPLGDTDTDAEGDGEEVLQAEALFVAIGRKTVTEDLNLGATSVELNERGEVRVDEFYRTAEQGVYAAGDVIGGYWLAHAAGHEGIIAVEHMAGEDPTPLDQDLIPRVTFCRPEVASFGLTEEQAREEGYEVKVGRFPFLALAKALVEGEEGGFVKVVVDAETDLILGMHAVGPHITDLIAEGVFAKLVEGTPEELGMAVHAHPTLSEAFGEAALAVEGRAINF